MESEFIVPWQSGEMLVLSDASGGWEATRTDDPMEVCYSVFQSFDMVWPTAPVDFLVVFMRKPLFTWLGGVYCPISNDVDGIGYDNYAGYDDFDGSPQSALQGVIVLNMAPGFLGNEREAYVQAVFDQELMHRWGAFVQADGGGANRLLGRGFSHWSFWLSTPNSPMEGNDWVDNGDGSFTSNADTPPTFSELDLYLMGVLAADEVAPLTLLTPTPAEEQAYGYDESSTPLWESGRSLDVSVGSATVTVDDIVRAEGRRSPDSTSSPRDFRALFAVLNLSDETFDVDDLAHYDALRVSLASGFEDHARGLVTLDTTLGTSHDLPCWSGTPDACPQATLPPEETGCGCGSPAPPSTFAALLALLATRRRRGH